MDKAGAKGDLIELFFCLSFCHYSDLIRVFLADNKVDVAASMDALQAFANALSDNKRRFIVNLQEGVKGFPLSWMGEIANDEAVSKDILEKARAAISSLKGVTLPRLQEHLRTAGLFVPPPNALIEDMTVTAKLNRAEGVVTDIQT